MPNSLKSRPIPEKWQIFFVVCFLLTITTIQPCIIVVCCFYSAIDSTLKSSLLRSTVKLPLTVHAEKGKFTFQKWVWWRMAQFDTLLVSFSFDVKCRAPFSYGLQMVQFDYSRVIHTPLGFIHIWDKCGAPSSLACREMEMLHVTCQ